MNASVRVQHEDFSVDAELRALRDVSPRIGGIASFVGCARDFSEGRAVREISFDAYARMVVPEMEALRRRVWRDQGVISLAIEDITDPWLRQAVQNEATRRWGPRNGGRQHGR